MHRLCKSLQIGVGSALVVVVDHVVNRLKHRRDGDGVLLRPWVLLRGSGGDGTDVRLVVLQSCQERVP